MFRPSSMRPAIALIVAVLSLAAYSPGLEAAPAQASTSAKAAKHKRVKRIHTVRIEQFLFQPQVLSVHLGDSVQWKNSGSVPHTATSNDGKTFDSSPIAAGRSWRFKPVKKGTFHYVCTLHPNMKGILIVQ